MTPAETAPPGADAGFGAPAATRVGAANGASATVADAIRHGILAGTLRAGDAVREEEWAANLGVSRTPVREAIGRLVAEGLLQKDARTAVVFRPSLEDLLEIYDIRTAVERLAARRATRRPAGGAAPLAAPVERALQVMAETPYGRDWFVAHERFHLGLYQAAEMPRLFRLIQALRSQSEPYVRFAVSVDDGFRRRSRQHHEAMARAVVEHDEDAMDDLIVAHLDATRQEIVKLLALGWPVPMSG